MKSNEKKHSMDRREFLKTSAAATVVSTAALSSEPASANAPDDGLDHRNERPDKMAYRRLGKTNFNCSRLVFGCGAALTGGKAVRLLEHAYEAGVNHFDIGTTVYYKGAEKALAPFLKKHGDDVWVTSKAFVRNGMGLNDKPYTVEIAKEDAKYWTKLMDDSLSDLGTDHVDAYYLMAIGNPDAVRSEELHNAFLAAKKAGKVDHFGISTHKRAAACIEAAIETGWYSLAMIGITPAGWYDWDTKSPLAGTATLKEIQPLLAKARKAGIGLVGMKAGRFIAPATSLGKGDLAGFDSHYDKKFMDSPLSPFQRSYAYVLEHGIDVMNCDMQNFKHFEENVVAARDSKLYFA